MAANSFSFFFKHVCNKPYKLPAILFAAHSNKLPAVMSVQEVYDVINAISNLKHKTLITLLYSTGMRLAEISNLKIEDIDSTLMRIKVVNGKGKKDRFVPLSPLVLEQLRIYYLQYKPTLFLFNGQGAAGRKYSPRSIQHVLQNNLIKIGLQHKNYSIHSIRHSFATHLIDNGADIQVIQELMGHHHIAQTTQYLHLSSKRINLAVNPYDAMLAQIKNDNHANKNI
jgi:integrase/recombinase XerD